MAWQAYAAAAAAPVVLSALLPRPKQPDQRVRAPDMPDRSAYINQYLNNAFSQNTDLYKSAADRLAGQINQQMALRGLANSSMADASLRSGLTDLNMRWMAEAAERERAALGLISQIDEANAARQMGINQANLAADWRQYEMANQNRQALIGGIGSVAQAGASGYARQQELDALRYRPTTVQYGVPSYGPNYGMPSQLGGGYGGY